jgi:hypothetical protein
MSVVAEDDTRLVASCISSSMTMTDGQPHRQPAHHPYRRRTGINTARLTCAAEADADAERATGKSTNLSVLEQNTVAQQLY